MNTWDKRYRRGDHLNDEPNPFITKFAAPLAPGRALDLACGVGRHSLWLAERSWQVTAVDYSRTAIEILEERSRRKGVQINALVADLMRQEFVIEPDSYDLIVDCNYLQRDLLPSIKAGTRIGGMVIVSIAMVDTDPSIKAMNPAYLLNAGELRAQFEGWTLIHDYEGKPSGDHVRRNAAEIVARKVKV